jgi:hypothetical protein
MQPATSSQVKFGLVIACASTLTFGRNRMVRTRIILGIVAALVGYKILLMLWVVRYDYNWNELGKWYQQTKKVAEIDLPMMIRILWPIAPAFWWGWISPIFFGVFVASRMRRALSAGSLLGILSGTVFLTALVYNTLVTYTRMTFYMGTPYEPKIEIACKVGNASLLFMTLGLAVYGIIQLRANKVVRDNGG